MKIKEDFGSFNGCGNDRGINSGKCPVTKSYTAVR